MEMSTPVDCSLARLRLLTAVIAVFAINILTVLDSSAQAATLEWSAVETDTTPLPRRSHAMTYDPDSKVIILFGGYGNGSHLGDTWALDMQKNTWKDMEPKLAPSPRAATTMVYDPEGSRMILFGGFSSGHSVVSNDTWSYRYSTNEWTKHETGVAPSERASYGMALDSSRHQVLLFGGFTDAGYFNDTWVLDLKSDSWRKIDIQGELPQSRGAMGFVYDTKNDVFIMFGGFSDSGFFKDTWIFDPDSESWTKMNPLNSPPPIRTRMVYENVTGSAVFFGGDAISEEDEDEPPTPYDKVWSYRFQDDQWVELHTNSPPQARALNGIAYDTHTSSVIVFGGTDTLIDSDTFVGREFQDVSVLGFTGYDSEPTVGIGSETSVPIGIGVIIAATLGLISVLRHRRTRANNAQKQG